MHKSQTQNQLSVRKEYVVKFATEVQNSTQTIIQPQTRVENRVSTQTVIKPVLTTEVRHAKQTIIQPIIQT